jgi:hypothetical protein
MQTILVRRVGRMPDGKAGGEADMVRLSRSGQSSSLTEPTSRGLSPFLSTNDVWGTASLVFVLSGSSHRLHS